MTVATCVLLAGALVADGGFEQGGKGWRIPKATCRVQAGAGLKGSHGLVWESDDPDVYRYSTHPLALEPGCAYSFSGWIREGEVTNARPRGRLTNLSIEWRDKDGKFMGVFGSNAVVDNQEREAGWTKYAGRTPVMPMNLGSAKIVCSALRGSTGRAVFDDIEVTPLASDPIPCMASSAYRDMAAAGNVAFAARCLVNPQRDRVEDLSGVFRFAGEKGELQVRAKVAPDGVVRGEVAVSRLAPGTHPVRIEVARADGSLVGSRELAFTRVAELPRRKVTFDEHGRTIVDGKPFFPLGLYSSRAEVVELDTYCEGPFNCILPYALLPKPDALDPYWQKGLRVIASVTDYAGIRGSKLKTISEERAHMSRYIEALKDHPALLAWYIADELNVGKAASLTARNMQIREADPDHPTFIVLDIPERPADFVEGYDVVGMDPYPIGNSGATRGQLSAASTYPEAAIRGMFGFRPMWQVPQAFDWSWHRPWAEKENNAHMPTLAEMRNMNWQAVASGANGLVGWWFAGMVRNLKKKGKMAEFRQAWGDVKAAYGEVAEKIPLLLSVEDVPKVVKRPQDMSVRAWRKDGTLWLLAVNRTYGPVSGQVELSDGQSVKVSLDGLGCRFVSIGK